MLEFNTTMKFPGDRTPNRKFWLLFKVASEERLLQMQKGLLYMNSLDFFSRLVGEEAVALRKDKLENVYAKYRAGQNHDHYGVLTINVGEGDNLREITLKEGEEITLNFPKPANTVLFCMGALADDKNGNIPGEKGGELYFDEKFLDFGDHILLITSPKEFFKRMNHALKNEKRAFGSPFMEGGNGLVDYVDLKMFSGNIGLFRKDNEYLWQREFRLSFGIENEALNQRGAYEFNIGDISDISNIIPVQRLIDTPMKLKRREFRQVDGEYIQV